jgi:hypothetical protein
MTSRGVLGVLAALLVALVLGVVAWVATRAPERTEVVVTRTVTFVRTGTSGAGGAAPQPGPSAGSHGSRASRTPPDAIDALEPSAEERAWLRDALVKERSRRAEAGVRPDDSGADVLRRYFDFGGDASVVLASFEAARRHVRIPEAAPMKFAANADGAPTDLSSAAKASVVEFGPGRFVISASRTFFDRRGVVEALEIRGAGKDATTLVLADGQEMFFSGDARNVVLRDLTIEDPRNGDTRFDLRGTTSLVCEGVRFVGWCATAGHSAAIGLSGPTFLACRDTEFCGPGDGHVLSARGPVLAVFERCTFSDVQSAVAGWGQRLPQRSRVVMNDCRFEGSRLADSRILVQGENRPDVQIDVRGGEAEFGAADLDEAARRRAWGEEFAASVDGTTFRPEALRFTGADLLRVLELAESRGWTPVVHAVFVPGTRRTPAQVDLYVAEGAKGTIERKTVEFAGGDLRDVGDTHRGRAGVAVRSASDVAGLLPLRALLARIPEFAAGPVVAVGYVQSYVNGQQARWTLLVQGSASRGRVIDATTGDDVLPR